MKSENINDLIRWELGLSIVKSIIDSNNGKIHVESEVGVGTTFFVYLKLAK